MNEVEPYLRQIRTDFNKYINGEITEKTDPTLVKPMQGIQFEDPKRSPKDITGTGLASNKKDFYKSPFIMVDFARFSEEGYPYDKKYPPVSRSNQFVIVFINNPQKVFTVAVTATDGIG